MQKRYTEIPELTGEHLNLFIERIDADECEKRYFRAAGQEIKIYYRDFAEEA